MSLQPRGATASAITNDDDDEDRKAEKHDTMDLSHISPSRHPMNRLRRLSKEEPYIHSVSQTTFGLNRMRNRRQSDPGRISVSPIRMRSRTLDDEICEDDEVDEDHRSFPHPRLQAVRSVSMTVPEEMGDEDDPNNRSRPRERAQRRAMRSNSLPTSDPAILELGEAIGAVAISRPPAIAEIPPLVESMNLSPGMMNRRRRSISIESTSLEAIDENNDTTMQAGSNKASARDIARPTLNT